MTRLDAPLSPHHYLARFALFALDSWLTQDVEALSTRDVLDDDQAMQLALRLALRGLGQVSPNPMVGCVITNQQGRVLGQGAHLRCGEGHAEVLAVADAKRRHGPQALQDAKVYVTLEPCSHFGKTPPCADMLAKEPIASVHYAMQDGAKHVDGKGLAKLQAAGKLCVHLDRWQPLAEELVHDFQTRQSKQRPFVALKVAQTINGIIGRMGQQLAITSQRSKAYGRYLRQWYDSIVVGAQTLLQDDPHLGPRLAQTKDCGAERMPLRIILDPQARTLQEGKALNHQVYQHQGERTLLCVGENLTSFSELRKAEQLGVRCLALPFIDHSNDPSKKGGDKHPPRRELNLHVLLEKLPDFGAHSLLLEGGQGVYSRFLAAGLVDRIYSFRSAEWWLGEDTLGLQGPSGPAQALPFTMTQCHHLGGDVLQVYTAGA